MPGRHQVTPVRRPLRWLAGGAGAAVMAAMALAYFPASAGASGEAVAATFGVTGVSTSNCSISTGGSDVYVKPDQDLDVKSSVIGLTVLGHAVDLSQVASFGGALVVDPSSAHPLKLAITDKVQTISGLTSGNHTFTWTISSVRLLGGLVPLPLSLSSSAVSAGAKLAYSGVIHVTPDAAQCGVAVQVPGVGVSASVTHLPPVNVSLPGVKLTVPVTVPSLSVPNLPGAPGSGGGTNSGGGASSGSNGELPVPARVVPQGDGGNFQNVAGGSFPGTLPGASALGTALPASSASGAGSSAAPTLKQDSTGKHKTIDLASNKAQSTGQFSVILAIIAIIALSVVAATYARLYLLRREA